MSENPEIIARRAGSIGRITLNRPQALNALNTGMVHAMTDALLAWRDDDGVKAVVVDAVGEKGFCAGGDIRMLHDSGKADSTDAWLFWRDEYRLNTLIREYPKPYLALIDGVTMGGGVGVSIHGSHRVAGDRTLFAMPETGIGFHPDVGGAYFLPRLPGEIGMWMGLTGARLKAADCLAAGLVTHFVHSERQSGLIAALESADLDADGETLEMLLERFGGDAGASDLGLTRGLVDAAFEGDDVGTMIERMCVAGDPWSLKQAKLLAGKSPTSLRLTCAALRRGAGLDFREVMRQDLRLSMRCLGGHDFYEGVRAVIIDKDNAPVWKPAALDAVSAGMIEGYFTPLTPDHEQSFIGD